MDLVSSLAVVADGKVPELISVASLVALLTLTVMEIVLGIDNIVFVSILVGKLPKKQQPLGRNIGLGLAMLMRLGLLFSISWVMGLTREVIVISEAWRPEAWASQAKSGLTYKDLILIAGGIFLLYKASREIFLKLEGEHGPDADGSGKARLGGTIVQIIFLDLIFSLDSVITAVGMIPKEQIILMVIAMMVAVGVMMLSAAGISRFVNNHPSVKILALSFLNLIGFMLVLEGTGHHINKGYIYSAMAFSLAVELLNMRFRKKHRPVHLNEPHDVSV